MREDERVVERVIQTLHENYGEPITIDDMARTAMYSKFHFTRIFQRVTGLTPGRFLSAVRLEKAKQLLAATQLMVTDISHLVGYSSVGTFSSRFTYNVGMSPTLYRRFGGFLPWSALDSRPAIAEAGRASSGRAAPGRSRTVIRGNLSYTEPGWDGPAFIGLFGELVPRGQPVAWSVVDGPGPYAIEDVPEGVWHLMACAQQHDQGRAGAHGGPANGAGRSAHRGGHAMFHEVRSWPPHHQGLSVAAEGPIVVRPGLGRLADVRMRPMTLLDPPILPALPDMRPGALLAQGFRPAG
ncbi:helix-turn-helix transcriptional regulator [Actinomadura livida]|uniref:AraC family transcriptional regulator n=2 Tax=Actinomadura livida TaxID=79909 RepID=A0ABN1DM64_9ACTN|nr:MULTISPECIES: AraC family transcriptional regulator [Actinomadura]GGU23087.1 AraC family transcriptional regulator [Actinomadura livida]